MANAQQKPSAGAAPDQNPLLHETERRNEVLVRSFCAAWSAMDPDAIVSHLDEECIYQIYEGGPVRHGVQEIHTTLTQFMTRWRSIEFRVFRLASLGSFVIHERCELYTGREGQADWEFNVTGTLWIPNGKIRHWRDDSLPGARQIFTR
ncbi:MAG: limonene-1,2-epoxide hydrolase family protein [Gammaproteobacteria bacterium]